MFSWYVAHVLSEWLWNSPSSPYYYWYYYYYYYALPTRVNKFILLGLDCQHRIINAHVFAFPRVQFESHISYAFTYPVAYLPFHCTAISRMSEANAILATTWSYLLVQTTRHMHTKSCSSSRTIPQIRVTTSLNVPQNLEHGNAISPVWIQR